VVKDLSRAGITAEAIHGNKSQNARQRALTNFKNRTTRVLVATDIAARGIDIDDLTHVINYEIPNIPETYVHRIGRTGRAGASGIALTFCDEDEKDFLKDIHKLIAKTIPVEEEHHYPMKQLTMQERIAKELKGKSQQITVQGPRNASAQRNPNANKAGGNRNWRRSR
jgi:ATP-dependent RNA helicase RhlE